MRQLSAAARVYGRTSVSIPKLSVTTSDVTRHTAPTGSSTGTTNQSLP